MSFRFQADANLNPETGFGLRRREPSIDFRNALGVIADDTPDPEVLRIAAEAGRVLVSFAIKTMPNHLDRYTGANSSSGLNVIPPNKLPGVVPRWVAALNHRNLAPRERASTATE